MAFIALAVALITFIVVKVLTLIKVGCGSDKRTLAKLWHMAVFKYLRQNAESPKKIEVGQPSKQDLVSISQTIQLLNETVTVTGKTDEGIDVVIQLSRWKRIWKTVIPCSLAFLLAVAMALSYLSYDLHPLTCLTTPGEDVITYKNERVEIKFPRPILNFQIVAVSLVFGISLLFLGLVIAFYRLTCKMVEKIYDDHKDYIASKIEAQHAETTNLDLTAQSITPTHQVNAEDVNIPESSSANILNSAISTEDALSTTAPK